MPEMSGQNLVTSGQKSANYRINNRTKKWVENQPRGLNLSKQETCDQTTAMTSCVVKMLNAMKSSPFSIILLVFLCQFSTVNSGLALNDFIRHFEPAHFSLEDLAESHRISKRSASSGSNSLYQTPVRFNFTAHNRLFLVSLQNSAQDVFSDDVIFENSQGPISFNTDHIYSGFLEDSPSSSVHGIVSSSGHFDGHISTPSEEYYIEPANRYFPDGSQAFHSVIYKTSDVLHPSEPNDNTKCKSHELHLKNKERNAKNAHACNFEKMKPHKSFNRAVNSTKVKRDTTMATEKLRDQQFEALPPEVLLSGESVPHVAKQTVTTYEVLDWEDVPESVRHHFRKRAKTANMIDVKKRTCMLYLQADHLFYENMGSEEACIEAMTRHVQRVNSIYNPIDFDQDGIADNISFMIKRIKVHTTEASKDPGYRFPGNYGVEKFLELFSEENYDAFCLAYMFTYRDFEGGTLGLAWTGDLKNAGGVCERNGHYRGSLKSLNTGIITFLNYGKHVPPAVSHVTMAHEMGHNFGSPHDPENNKACVPGGDDGNYIMFARATSGDKKNNRNFSPCSLKSIKPVLLAKARGPKGCFKEPQTALCGNGVVEDGEECDCGWAEDCTEDCCWPQRTEFANNEKPCTLRPTKVCSPTQGPCCTNDCEFRTLDKCRDDNGCRGESFCDGTGPHCPNSDLKPNKTVCHEEFVCYKGECTGSICLAYGMESCQCSQGPDDPATKSCELCCKEPGDDKPCMSSFQLNEPPWDVPDMFSKPGTPCNNYKGYCDVFQKCRQIDPSGPLATLRKLLLSEESIASLKKFLAHYWYTVIFIILGVLILMALIVRFCGKKTPLVVRKRRHRRSVHHETADPEDQVTTTEENGGSHEDFVQVHPAVVELSLPFGKKVRLGERKKSSTSRSSRHGDNSTKNYRVLESVARATRLAGNLGQRIANLPNTSSDTNPIAAHEDLTSSPKKENRKSRSHKSSGVGIINTKRRPFKSLSPDKRLLAKNLAESVSRSFEKLDLVSPRRIVAGRKKKTNPEGDARSSSADADNRRRKRKERSSKEPTKTAAPVVPPATSSKELTIAKLGRFTFSLEVNNAAKKVPEVVDPEKEERRKRRERRKKSRDEQNKRRVKKEGEKEETEVAKVAETDVRRIPSLVVVSKRQKSDRPLRASTSPEKRAADDQHLVVADYRLTFGRKQKMTSDAFSRSISHPGPPPNLDEILLAGLDSKKSIKRNNSIAGDKLRPQKSSSKLKRSETEKSSSMEWSKRLGGVGSSNSAALLLSPKPAFENRAYDKSPEPTGAKSESVSHQKSESLSYLRDQIKSSLNPEDSSSRKAQQRRSRPALLTTKASSLDAPSNKAVSSPEEGFYIELDSDTSSSSLSESKRRSPPTQVQSLSEDSNLGQFDNDISSSSDSEMEIVVNGQKSLGNNLGAVSRSRIIERAVKKESLPETQSRALLLASSLSSSSLSMSPSEDEEKSNLKQRKKELLEPSSVDFIFPGDETPSIQQTSLSVSSLSERYSRKDSASSTTSSLSLKSANRRKASKSKSSPKTNKSEDLDNISILTDGMG